MVGKKGEEATGIDVDGEAGTGRCQDGLRWRTGLRLHYTILVLDLLLTPLLLSS